MEDPEVSCPPGIAAVKPLEATARMRYFYCRGMPFVLLEADLLSAFKSENAPSLFLVTAELLLADGSWTPR